MLASYRGSHMDVRPSEGETPAPRERFSRELALKQLGLADRPSTDEIRERTAEDKGCWSNAWRVHIPSQVLKRDRFSYWRAPSGSPRGATDSSTLSLQFQAGSINNSIDP
jgi:hypothetical protein